MSAAPDLETTLRAQIDEIVRTVIATHSDPARGAAITRILYRIDQDWAGNDAIHFTAVLHDPPGGADALPNTQPLREQLYDLVYKYDIDRMPFVSIRLESEQKAIEAGTYFAEDDDAT